MSKQVEAIRMLVCTPLGERILAPVFNPKNETLDFSAINYGALSGGEKTFVSWAWYIWMDKETSRDPVVFKEFPDYPMRDGVEGFGVLSPEYQRVLLMAFAYRWGIGRIP